MRGLQAEMVEMVSNLDLTTIVFTGLVVDHVLDRQVEESTGFTAIPTSQGMERAAKMDLFQALRTKSDRLLGSPRSSDDQELTLL